MKNIDNINRLKLSIIDYQNKYHTCLNEQFRELKQLIKHEKYYRRASDRSSKRSGGKKKSLTEITDLKAINDGTVLIQKEESATGSVS